MGSTDIRTSIGGVLESRRPRILYLVYWGAAEPLGQSLVLPAVIRLAALGAELTLVTFEKPGDLYRKEETSRIKQSLGDQGVRWIPLRYHKWPKIPATGFDIGTGVARAILASLKARPDIIHARTFIGGLIGLALAPLLKSKFVYHNEGFYPDEQVDAGVWAKDSRPHRLAKLLERKLYERADAVIALSHGAKVQIEKLSEVERKGTPVIVVPSCVDLNHFQPNSSNPPVRNDEVRFVYVGSVGGRYSLDRIARFVSVASSQLGRTWLRVLTKSDRSLVARMLEASGLSDDLWSVDSVPYLSMPKELARQRVGLHFLPQGLGDHGGSPTKIGEYWAAGLPVVVTPNAGDTDEIIRRERVGVILSEHSDAAYHKAATELRSLLGDEGLAKRCRNAAETHYALDLACERQVRLYQDLTSKLVSPGSVHASETDRS